MDSTPKKLPVTGRDEAAPAPRAYEPPRILQKRSVARVTLVSGVIGGCNPGDPSCGTLGGH
jgi:hypothetical protein